MHNSKYNIFYWIMHIGGTKGCVEYALAFAHPEHLYCLYIFQIGGRLFLFYYIKLLWCLGNQVSIVM